MYGQINAALKDYDAQQMSLSRRRLRNTISTRHQSNGKGNDAYRQ